MRGPNPHPLVGKIIEIEHGLFKDPHVGHFFKDFRPQNPEKMQASHLQLRHQLLVRLDRQIGEWRKSYEKAASHLHYDQQETPPAADFLDSLTRNSEVKVDAKFFVLNAICEKWVDEHYHELPETQSITHQPIGGGEYKKVGVEKRGNWLDVIFESKSGGRVVHKVPLTEAFFKRCKDAAEKFANVRETIDEYVTNYE